VTESVRWDLDGAVATITLNRPQARNALTAELKTALLGALRQAASSPQVRAVLITGAGQAFCAGQDLREHADLLGADGPDDALAAGAPPSGAPAARTPAGSASAVVSPPAGPPPPAASAPLDTVREHYNPLVLAIRSMPKPVIAAVNGVAAGAGAGLAFACDLRIAAQGASFLMAFARVGLAADTGVSWTLPRLAGAGRAAELLMLAEPIGAPQALALGLVNQVVEDADLPAVAGNLAARLAAGPTAAYAGIKRQLNAWLYDRMDGQLELEAQVQREMAHSDDFVEGVSAFLQKRPPAFSGR
jgi:2-(1,2-epoxy-1,2-dihydrophenyl)acetyl-CoA isomerase